MLTHSYDEARPLIQDGDIVFLHGSWSNPIQAIIMLFTASKFSHVCMAFTIKSESGSTERLLCVEAQNTHARRILSLSYYDDRQMTVLAAPRAWQDIQDQALGRVGKAKYSLVGAAYAGIRELVRRAFNVHLPPAKISRETCSELMAKLVGLEDTEISPQLLYEELLKVTTER